jgi:hypothetical protein
MKTDYCSHPPELGVLAAPRRRIWFLTFTAAPQGHHCSDLDQRCFDI